MKKICMILLMALVLTGCGENKEGTVGKTEESPEVAMEEVYAAQEREKLLEEYQDVLYEFHMYRPEETGTYSYYHTDDYLFFEEEGYAELWKGSKYFYAVDENGYFASVYPKTFDLTEYDNYIFGTEEERAEKPQTLIDSRMDGELLKVVTQYDNPDIAARAAKVLDLTYEEGCEFQSIYMMDADTFTIFEGKDVFIDKDGGEHVIMDYQCIYNCGEEEVPERFIELQARMNETENTTKYTVIYLDDSKATGEINVTKGDEFGMEIDEEKYGIYYDEEGQNPAESNAFQSDEDSLTLYIIEK